MLIKKNVYYISLTATITMYIKNNLKKGQYFLNVTPQPITFATPR